MIQQFLTDLAYPPVLMAFCAIAFMFLAGSPYNKIPAWRYWTAVVILSAGMLNFFGRVAYGLWKMYA